MKQRRTAKKSARKLEYSQQSLRHREDRDRSAGTYAARKVVTFTAPHDDSSKGPRMTGSTPALSLSRIMVNAHAYA